MLGLSDATELSEQLWHALTSRVQLPEEVEAAQRKSAREGVKPDCQRQYARKSLQSPAILIDGDAHHACRAKDISRVGVGFYAPRNLLPKKVIRLWLPNGGVYSLRVTRCRRLTEWCYEVGTRFHATTEK